MPTTNPILIAAAVIPAIALLVKVYRADRLEKEPVRLILRLVLQGIFATVLAAVAEGIGLALLNVLLRSGSLLHRLIFNFAVVGLAEEGFKYLLLKRKTWNSGEFNCQFDGVVYAVAVSLGFALWENIGYVASYGLLTALVRSLTAVPGHACFGVFMGAYFGAAKRYQKLNQSLPCERCLRLSLLIPVLLHGGYDFIAEMGSGISILFILFVAGLFFFASRMVKRLSAADRYITTSAIYYGEDY